MKIEIPSKKSRAHERSGSVGREDMRSGEHVYRQAWRRVMATAHQNRRRRVVFSGADHWGCLAVVSAAKIAAQEIFRHVRERSNRIDKLFFEIDEKDRDLFRRTFVSYLEHVRQMKAPFVTVDGIVVYRGGIILVRRANPPFGWALPGGFVDYGESLESAIKREVREETGLRLIGARQMRTYSAPGRDPRFHTVSTVFVGRGSGRLVSGSDADAAVVFPLGQALSLPLAFDHRQILRHYQKQMSS